METTRTTNLKKEYQEEIKTRRLKIPNYANIFSFQNRAAYKQFCEETGRTDISYDTFIKVPREVNRLAGEKVATGRYAVRFPNLGVLKVIATVPYSNRLDKPGKVKTRPDWRHYNATGEMRRVPVGNIDGKVYRLYFYPYFRKSPLLAFFTFKASPQMKKLLEKNIKSGKMAGS